MVTLNEMARKALFIAGRIAIDNGMPFFDTQHVLFGLIKIEDSITFKVLESMGVNLEGLLINLEELIAHSHGDYMGERVMGYTGAVRTILMMARDEAADEVVTPENLLIAIVKDRLNPAAELLEAYGVNSVVVLKQHLEKVSGQKGSTTMNTAIAISQAPKLDPKSTLAQIGATDLTAKARENKLDPVIGRDSEIDRAIKILVRRRKNNVALIGDPGVGKTTVAEGLALKIASGDVPKSLRNKIVVTLEMSALVAGTMYRGQFEERIRAILEEIRKDGNIILFIDEMHTIIGAGNASGGLDASNMMKAALARGEMQCIGATTIKEYRNHIEKDPAMARRFQPLMVGQPSAAETIEILQGIRENYERHHGVYLTEEALVAAVRLSDRYINDRFQPDKSIDLIDEAAADARARAESLPEEGLTAQREIRKLRHGLKVALHNHDIDDARKLKDRIREVSEILREVREKQPADSGAKEVSVGALDIERVVSDWTGIPLQRLTEDEAKQLLELPSFMHKKVIGQDEPIEAIAAALRRARAGLKDPKKPIGSFLFLGPTGVGKTEVARTLALLLFGTVDAMTRIDMSEYMEKHTVSRLIGAPPGYVGYDQPGALTEPVRRRPFSVILLDEVEKAHPDVWNILLQVLDDGRLTDGQGRTVDFKNTIIIMTSNAGVKIRKSRIGFRHDEDELDVAERQAAARDEVLEQIRSIFSPEWLNRIDEILVFHQLSPGQIRLIVDLRMEDLNRWLADRELTLVLSDECKALLARKGYDPTYGARPLNRVIQKLVQDPLAVKLLERQFQNGDVISARLEGESIVFEPSLRKAA
jgi:ATP-dependent Clp protease ATP-binding subunit ClpC